MAQEYIAMNTKENGVVALSTNVFSSIALICVEEDKRVELADSAPFKNSIVAKVVNDRLNILVNIKVKYNTNVQEVCASLQHNIYDNIKHMCDIEADEIDIKVSGFDFKE
ncbi:putative alkaline shock family protein YloU [Breznakia sp. PF5-3]|uniref:Asp23/Gls24 family envelope stress response protein n=1 Tax=unclassified Breznakia TaxID=2623764 RepID=UPI00240605D0|nr:MULTISPECIES: Asp23/Gls24 family envelope stress response protein [unclassified Breznakia]MDL2276468.1 Asp23/Gls24 family envelope stress response protein [Breznakia sp. OttesenSCG-928-G09]MDF9823907.1 putative alkaline shock family protein YloU [Breznakia sp. PM6-1]MDF9834706.1 putative alkaline shock family protein YloU [Breznakia sp. PF5-3]MDF9836859.1 putative alkaline shock family protein YloU [Breznakia sp. PFB2-8]MDF9858876.1 putative alkaline shock family protein YloU [Breznakia sp.